MIPVALEPKLGQLVMALPALRLIARALGPVRVETPFADLVPGAIGAVGMLQGDDESLGLDYRLDPAARGRWATCGVMSLQPYRVATQHPIDQYWSDACSLLGAYRQDMPPHSAPMPRLPVQERPSDAIVFCVGAANPQRIWPGWRSLAAALEDEHILVMPGPDDAPVDLPGVQVRRNVGTLEYAQVLAGARCVIANDSGPMHLAAAVGAPVLGIFGASEPRLFAPRGPRAAHLGSNHQWPALGAVIEWIAAIVPNDTTRMIWRV